MKNRYLAISIVGIVVIIIIAAYSFGKSSSSKDSQSLNANISENQPATSNILDSATQPNYNGADLAKLRIQCTNQSQGGFNSFVLSQRKIESQAGITPGNYTIGDHHFNAKIGACLVVAYDDFTGPNNAPSETTHLVNIYENKSIMSCTTYGNPITSALCYGDNGYNLISRDDWNNIFNQYMSQ